MSFQKLKLSISKHTPSSQSSRKPANPASSAAAQAVKPQQAPTPTPKPPQAVGAPNNTTTNPLRTRSRHRIHHRIRAQPSPTSSPPPPSARHQRGLHPKLHRPRHPAKNLACARQPTRSGRAAIRHRPNQNRAEILLIKVGTIPKGKLTTARNILGKQKPGDGWLGGERYDSKEWVKLVLEWWADDAGFRWEEGAQVKVRALPVG